MVVWGLLTGCMLTVVAAALVYERRGWPDELDLGVDVPDGLPGLAGALAAVFAVVCVVLTGYHAQRWIADRTAERVPQDPAVRPYLPVATLPPPAPVAAGIPTLGVDVVDPRDLVDVEPRPIGPSTNVLGAPPVRIAALRAFENQPRLRTLLEGAWRELGPVLVLRSVASLSPGELRAAHGDVAGLLVRSADEMARIDERPLPPGRRTLRRIARQPVHVDDPYGAYPALGYLGDGTSWAHAQTRSSPAPTSWWSTSPAPRWRAVAPASTSAGCSIGSPSSGSAS